MHIVKQSVYIWDLDGTLADCQHRRHFIAQQPKDHRAFFAACGDDLPIHDNIALYKELNYHHPCIIVSGRSDECRDQTCDWLSNYGLIYLDLFMRKAGDHRPDELVKAEIYYNHIKDMYNVLGIFDDRDRVVAMWRRLGLRCYQVAPGNF